MEEIMAKDGGWVLPFDPDAETICLHFNIPNDINAIAATFGALWEMSKAYNWQQSDPQEAIDFARRMELLLLDDFAQIKTNTECGMNCSEAWACLSPYIAFAFTPASAQYRVVDGVAQISLDNGTTWNDIPPDDGVPLYPPLKATPGATDEDKLCLASQRAVNTLAALYQQTAGAVAAGLLNTLNAIDNFLMQVNMLIADFLWGHATAIVRALEWDGADLPTDFAAPTLNAAAQDALLCLLLDNASVGNGIVTFDYQAVFDNLIAELGVNPGTAVSLLLAYIGGDGLNRAGNVENAETGDCSACVGLCVDYTDTMETEQGPLTHEIPYNGINNIRGQAVRAGFWQATGGRVTGGSWASEIIGTFSGFQRRSVGIVVDLGEECDIDAVSLWSIAGSNGQAQTRQIWYRGAALENRGDLIDTTLTSTGWLQLGDITNRTAVRYIVFQIEVNNNNTPSLRADDITITVLR